MPHFNLALLSMQAAAVIQGPVVLDYHRVHDQISLLEADCASVTIRRASSDPAVLYTNPARTWRSAAGQKSREEKVL
jgi:hypothetical protein